MPNVPTLHFGKFLRKKIKSVVDLRGAAQEDQPSLPPATEKVVCGIRSSKRHGSLDALNSLTGQVAEVYMSSHYDKFATREDSARSSASTSEGTLSEIGSDSDGTDICSNPDSNRTCGEFSARDKPFSLPSRPLPSPGLPPRAPDSTATTSVKNADDAASKKASTLMSKWKRASKIVRGHNDSQQARDREQAVIEDCKYTQAVIDIVQEEADAVIEALQVADMALDLHFDMLDALGSEDLEEESDVQVACREAETALELHFQWLEDAAEEAKLLNDDDESVGESTDHDDDGSVDDNDSVGEAQTQWEMEASLNVRVPSRDVHNRWFEM